MKKLLMALQVLICLTVAVPFSAGGETLPPAAGESFPGIQFSAPGDKDHRTYLGVSRNGTFTMPQVKAEVVIVEVLSMYCPFCQAEAPRVNELYKLIQKDPKLKGRIKIIGIAAGNSTFEADVFRKKYAVPFPIFSDGDFSYHKILGEVRTPYFIGVKIEKDVARVFYSKLGGFKDADQFLKLMIQQSGL